MFNKSNLAVVGALSKDHFCKSVFFSKDGTLATDGHIAVSVSLPSSYGEHIKDAPLFGGRSATADIPEFEVDGESVKSIIKAIPKNGNFPIMRNAFVIEDEDGTKLVTTNGGAQMGVWKTEVHESYRPAMRDLSKYAPEGEPVFSVCLNGHLLARLTEILNKAVDNSYATPLTFSFWAKDKAIKVEAKNIESGQDITGLIMPYQK